MTATFQAGVLTVVGDHIDNVVEVFERRANVVDVVGDGQRHSFSGVDEILIQTLAGDDRVSYSAARSFQIISAGRDRLLDIDVGEGNDRVSVFDYPGEFAQRFDGIDDSNFELVVNLGTGRDRLQAGIRRHYEAGIDVRSADGGDRVAIDLLLPAGQKVQAAAVRANLALAGGGNSVGIEVGNFDDVALSLLATPSSAASDAQDNLYSFKVQAPLFQPFFPSRFILHETLSDTNDHVQVDARRFAESSVELDTGGGDDSVAVQARAGTPFSFTSDPRAGGMLIDTGEGNDRLAVDSEGYDRLESQIIMGGGDDQANIRYRSFAIVDRTQLSAMLDLGGGDDFAHQQFVGYTDVTSRSDAGAGDDTETLEIAHVGLQQGGPPVSPGTWILDASFQLGAGSDRLTIATLGYHRIATDVDTGPAGDGRDTVVAQHLLLPPRGRLHRLLLALDGGLDESRLLAIGYPEPVIRTEQTRQVTLIQDV